MTAAASQPLPSPDSGSRTGPVGAMSTGRALKPDPSRAR
jgi:hypothetical protein